MILPRLIPCLLLRRRGFVKTLRFSDPVYLGDPLNILKIFNEKEVDEIFILDILASAEKKAPQFDYLSQISRECFMPLGYGGGIRTLSDAERIFKNGYEKIVLNTASFESPKLVGEIAKVFGSQSVVVSIDAKSGLFGRRHARIRSGTQKVDIDPVSLARRAENEGAGEILVTSIDRDGTMRGYDIDLVKSVAAAVEVPVIACGGAGSLEDMACVIREGNASAAAAGSFFVFKGPHRAVLINAPSHQEAKKHFFPEVRT